MRNLRGSYQFYRETTAQPVDIKTYLKIVHGFILFIMQKVWDGWDVQLSGGNSLGSIGMRGKRIQPKVNDAGQIVGLAPDWVKTKKYWAENPEARERKQLIFHFNEHSGGIRYRIVWYKNRMILPNKSCYVLQFSRHNKRTVPKLIRSGKEYLITNED
jgi:hypothetical protein